MNQPITKSSLTPSLAHLVELLQTVNFGRIEHLTIRSGQPVFNPPPRVIQKLKMGADNGPRSEVGFDDFRLKNDVIELLELIERIGDGEIRQIEVRWGLPVCVEIDWGPSGNQFTSGGSR